MDLSKNNTSLKKYFGIIQTESTDTTFYSPPAKANEGLGIPAAGAGPPSRWRNSVQLLLRRDRDASFKGRQE